MPVSRLTVSWVPRITSFCLGQHDMPGQRDGMRHHVIDAIVAGDGAAGGRIHHHIAVGENLVGLVVLAGHIHAYRLARIRISPWMTMTLPV